MEPCFSKKYSRYLHQCKLNNIYMLIKHLLKYGCIMSATIVSTFLVQSCSQHKGSFHINGDIGNEHKYVAVELRDGNHPLSASFKFHRIRNGKVSLDLDLDSNKVYEIDVFDNNKSSWFSCCFFADCKGITIKPGDSTLREWIAVSDSPQNVAYQEFQEGLDKAIAASGIRDSIKMAKVSWDETYSPEYRALHARCFSDTTSTASQLLISAEMERMEQDGSAWTMAGQHLNSLRKQYGVLMDEYYKTHIDEVPFGLASFNVLVDALEDAQMNDLDVGYWLAYYQKEYAWEFPDCNLHNNVLDVIGKSTMVEGKHYVDFSLPDERGQIQTVSELIDGKVAVIELWASWCHPCLKRLIEMKPLYEKYKDKGFVIVTAAREDVNDEEWRRILAKEKFSWVNMIDLDPMHPIWSSYGDANGSGSAYLFGTDGRLIKKSPSFQDIENAIIISQE